MYLDMKAIFNYAQLVVIKVLDSKTLKKVFIDTHIEGSHKTVIDVYFIYNYLNTFLKNCKKCENGTLIINCSYS